MQVKNKSGRETVELAGALRREGLSVEEIVRRLRIQRGINARVAWRLARGLSQKAAADRWNELWPENLKTDKNFSYWEVWPSKTGHAPSLDVLDKLAQLYECNIADLLADLGNYRPGSHDENIAVSDDFNDEDWYTESVSVLLNLERDTPEAIEERTVIAARAMLEKLDNVVSVPRREGDASAGHGLEIEILYGGLLAEAQRPSESQFRYAIELPWTLGAGDRHEYVLRVRIPHGQPMAPHYVLIPLRRSMFFRLRLKFGASTRPKSVWSLDGVPPASIYDPEPPGRLVQPNRFGEVCADFRNLRLGQAYGLLWR